MNRKDLNTKDSIETFSETEFEGVYGKYRITLSDQMEVQRYRISVLILAISFSVGLGHWMIIGPTSAWIWLLPMCISLGLALQWIHIYFRLLHRLLKGFWILGCLGIGFLLLNSLWAYFATYASQHLRAKRASWW